MVWSIGDSQGKSLTGWFYVVYNAQQTLVLETPTHSLYCTSAHTTTEMSLSAFSVYQL